MKLNVKKLYCSSRQCLKEYLEKSYHNVLLTLCDFPRESLITSVHLLKNSSGIFEAGKFVSKDIRGILLLLF